jgi:hypothetical protein
MKSKLKKSLISKKFYHINEVFRVIKMHLRNIKSFIQTATNFGVES